MNALPSITPAQAALPQTYEAARKALATCENIDECKDWADKAAALASYAKQAEDDQLERMAQRIRMRAVRRAGELMKQIEPQRGGDRKSEQYQSAGDHTLVTRADAAREAGMSKHQQMQATRIANVPEVEFEALVESDRPPTVTALAQRGTTPRPEPKQKPEPRPLVDLKGRDPRDFSRALHFLGTFENYAREIEAAEVDEALPILTDEERAELRGFINRIDAIHDRIMTRI